MPFSGPERRQKVLVLLTMCFALFMAMLDNTVVNVALPTISRELGAGVSGLQWIVDGYILAFAGLLLTGGIVGDRFGRKKAFMGGLALFTFASLLCGLAPSTGFLVAARVLQGVAAALVQPGTLAIITNTFPVHERAQAIGIWAGVSGIALALGPTAGGWMVEHVGWESVFFLNVPIGIVGLAIGSYTVRESRDPDPRPFDVPGLMLGTVGLTSIVYGLIEANQLGWTDPLILAALLGGLAVGGLFLAWEARSPAAMFPLSLLRIRAFSAGLIVGFTISFGLFGTFFFASLYLQLIRGYSAFGAGVRLLPVTGTLLFVAPVAGKLAQKYGSRWPMTAGLLTAGSSLVLYSRVSADTPYPILALVLLPMGIGMGLTMAPMTAAVMNAVGPQKAGLGSSMSNAAREVGGVFGVALLGTLLTTVMRRSITTALAGATTIPPFVRQAVIDSAGRGELGAANGLNRLPGPMAATIRGAVESAFMDGFSLALLVAGLMVWAAAGVAFALIPSGTPQDRDSQDPGAPAGEGPFTSVSTGTSVPNGTKLPVERGRGAAGYQA